MSDSAVSGTSAGAGASPGIVDDGDVAAGVGAQHARGALATRRRRAARCTATGRAAPRCGTPPQGRRDRPRRTSWSARRRRGRRVDGDVVDGDGHLVVGHLAHRRRREVDPDVQAVGKRVAACAPVVGSAFSAIGRRRALDRCCGVRRLGHRPCRQPPIPLLVSASQRRQPIADAPPRADRRPRPAASSGSRPARRRRRRAT